ncbi:hypothetical protein FQA39_LY03313 [Lamprigera yunnana]|nr:hypothetical protein FQA39_LY03313 [Lamprigera yunnana]
MSISGPNSQVLSPTASRRPLPIANFTEDMCKNLKESINSRRSNKELAKCQITSKTSSTKKLLLEAKLKAEIELNEIMKRKEEIQRFKLALKKRMIQTKYQLEKVKLRDKRELRDTNTEDVVHKEHNLSVAEKVKYWLTVNKRQVKDDNITVNNFDLEQLLMPQNIDKDLPFFHGEIREWQNFL